MGRVKLEIKRIENTNNRLVTFAKRKAGLIKKAQELATLCDIDVALIMFSPGNKLTQIEEIISRYANVPESERRKRFYLSHIVGFSVLKHVYIPQEIGESSGVPIWLAFTSPSLFMHMQQLNRAIRKLKGEPEAGNFPRFSMTLPQFKDVNGDFNMEFAQGESAKLQTENENAHRRLRMFQGDDTALGTMSYEDLLQMELEVQTAIDKVRLRKQIIEYNMKEVGLVPGFGSHTWPAKDIDMKFYKEDPESEVFGSRPFYVADQGHYMLNPCFDFNQSCSGGFMPQQMVNQLEPFVENGEQSIVVDSTEQSFPLVDSEFDCHCQEVDSPAVGLMR